MRNQTIVSCCTLLLAACASPAPVAVPDTLNPGANEVLAMIVPARGVQIYACRARKEVGSGYEWAFVAPEAELFDVKGNAIGGHSTGPTWQATDGSRIVGTLKQRANAPVAGAVPWLLLSAKSNGTPGAFSSVTSIQRVNTVGGVAPATPCTSEAAGKSARIDYTADYFFFTHR